MRSAAERIAAYEARMQSTQIDPVLTSVSAQAQANFATYATEWVAKQTSVHQYLDAQSVWPAEYFNYSAFAMEVFHVSKHFSGTAAINAAQDLDIKFVMMQCQHIHLVAIAAIFNITIV